MVVRGGTVGRRGGHRALMQRLHGRAPDSRGREHRDQREEPKLPQGGQHGRGESTRIRSNALPAEDLLHAAGQDVGRERLGHERRVG